MDIKEVLEKINWSLLYEQRLVLTDVLDFIKESNISVLYLEYIDKHYHKDDPCGEYLDMESSYTFNSIDSLINLLNDVIQAAEDENLVNYNFHKGSQ